MALKINPLSLSEPLLSHPQRLLLLLGDAVNGEQTGSGEERQRVSTSISLLGS